MSVFLQLLALGVILLTLDFTFLTLSSSRTLPVYESIQGSPVVFNYGAAMVCYAIIILGFYYFIIREKRSIWDAFLLGLFVYGVYDGTTLAVFKKYTLLTAGIDMMWGGVLFGSTAFLYYRLFG